MKASAALVLGAEVQDAGTTAASEALASLGTDEPTLALLFASSHYAEAADSLAAAVRSVTGPVPTVGCVAGSVIGGPREVESGPVVAVMVASRTGPVETFALEHEPSGGNARFSGHNFRHPGPYVVLCDPLTFPAGLFLEHLNDDRPGSLVAGGMTGSGDGGQGANLFLDGKALSRGAVGMHMPRVRMDLLVAQGCRPIGDPFTVTRVDGNILYELGGKAPFERLQEMVGDMRDGDRRLLANGGLQLGRVIDEYRAEQRRGDFLIRNVLGADPSSGAMVVGDQLEVGQTVQFHLRDAESADEELRGMLEREHQALDGASPAAALLFTCNGRGQALFGRPHHDAGMVAEMFGAIPAAGCFCAGELGPVGGKNFLHGFTASIALMSDGGPPMKGEHL